MYWMIALLSLWTAATVLLVVNWLMSRSEFAWTMEEWKKTRARLDERTADYDRMRDEVKKLTADRDEAIARRDREIRRLHAAEQDLRTAGHNCRTRTCVAAATLGRRLEAAIKAARKHMRAARHYRDAYWYANGMVGQSRRIVLELYGVLMPGSRPKRKDTIALTPEQTGRLKDAIRNMPDGPVIDIDAFLRPERGVVPAPTDEQVAEWGRRFEAAGKTFDRTTSAPYVDPDDLNHETKETV